MEKGISSKGVKRDQVDIGIISMGQEPMSIKPPLTGTPQWLSSPTSYLRYSSVQHFGLRFTEGYYQPHLRPGEDNVRNAIPLFQPLFRRAPNAHSFQEFPQISDTMRCSVFHRLITHSR